MLLGTAGQAGVFTHLTAVQTIPPSPAVEEKDRHWQGTPLGTVNTGGLFLNSADSPTEFPRSGAVPDVRVQRPQSTLDQPSCG